MLAPAALGSGRSDLRVAVTLRPGPSSSPGASPSSAPGTALALEGLADQANFALHVSDDQPLVLERRARLERALELSAVQWLQQIHSDRVQPAAAYSAAREPEADAALSARPGAAVAVLTADCLPVVLWVEAEGGPVAVVHAGWQGLALGILSNAVQALRQEHGTADPLRAWIGPSICAAHYEVTADLLTRFVDPPAARSARLGDRRQLDLAALAVRQLALLGVAEVVRSGWCSYGLPAFYSHRRAQHQRQPGTGRMATLAWYR